MTIRIGIGYDLHRLVEGRKLIIGGVEIPYEKGLFGHSDADVLTHALCDALLGAAALGDIGQHFSDKDPRFAGIDSLKMLAHVIGLVREQGFVPVNVDANVVAEAPKLAPHIPRMREKLAAILELPVSAISVKAKTNEKVDATGRGEAIAAQAAVLIQKT
ncbi:MAG: 2-C-methyl-D-erythritol 2,4-cyclodiphosphate synthase [Blastocatellia bacterium]|nr:2-C-methyl-D-erythritol 2,4-cyclodiphosphate synthase [Blastocatellia bacterium]